MWDTNPWARWGITYTTRDGAPAISETGLWDLWSRHPDAVEKVNDHQYWLHLDQPYLAKRYPNRAYFLLEAHPFRKKGASGV
jgi:hypothetical protein